MKHPKITCNSIANSNLSICSNLMYKNSDFSRGVKGGFPILVGYLPYGIAYGLLAKQAGLTFLLTIAMSTLVVAGTAQFIAVAMIQTGYTWEPIVFTTFIVNLRYLLLGSVLSQLMRGWKVWERFALSYFVTDETFVVVTNHAEKTTVTQSFMAGVNGAAVFGWVFSSAFGFLLGQYIPNLKIFGFDFALCAILIGLSVLMTRNRKYVKIAILASVVSVVLFILGLQKINILVAALVAGIVGVSSSWSKHGNK